MICQSNIYTTSFLNKALDSEMVVEEDRGNCPICVETIQVGDQVLVVSPTSLFPLQLSLWDRYLADNVPWMRCLATPRLPPWVPKGLALKVSDNHLCLLITPFIFSLTLCSFFLLHNQAIHLPTVSAEALISAPTLYFCNCCLMNICPLVNFCLFSLLTHLSRF